MSNYKNRCRYSIFIRIMVYQCPSVGPVRPFHMSRSNLRTPWPIHFKFHRVIGIDGPTVCILYGEISIFHMSRCKLRTPSPIHFKLRTVIGIYSLYWFLKKCVVLLCLNDFFSTLWINMEIFHSRVMRKKVFTNIVWMLTTGVSCALGAAVYLLWNKIFTRVRKNARYTKHLILVHVISI